MRDLRGKVRERFDEREQRPPLEKLRAYLHGYFADASESETEAAIRRQLRRTDVPLPGLSTRHALEGLAFVLDGSMPEGALSDMVAWDANRVLDDPTDRCARRWLEKLAGWLREELKASGARTRW